MSEAEFIEVLTDIIYTEKTLTMETKLNEIEEWDSTSIILFLSFCTTKFPARPALGDEIKSAQIVKDLYKFIGEK